MIKIYCFIILYFFILPVKADQFCFAFAETYYEQVYCQLQARAQAKSLPPFHQFKKNNEQVQFSLLKRLAERNAIKLPAPLANVTVEPQASIDQSPPKVTVIAPVRSYATTDNRQAFSSCQLQGRTIQCFDTIYELLGNKANHRLAAGVLEVHNTMALPAAVNGGLTKVYEQYISKMCEIGLCAVTMTYKKFSYLHQDLQTKGLDFSQRFETMFGFLKKDKAAMAVSESLNIPPALNLADCSVLGEHYYVCDHQGRNYIFVRK